MKNAGRSKANRDREPIVDQESRTGPTPASISYPSSAGTSTDARDSAASSEPVVRATTANEVRRPTTVTDIDRYRSKPLDSNSVEAANAPRSATGGAAAKSRGQTQSRRKSS